MTDRRSPWRITQETYPCDTCGAQPGEPCFTTGGLLADMPHADRARQANGTKPPRVQQQ